MININKGTAEIGGPAMDVLAELIMAVAVVHDRLNDGLETKVELPAFLDLIERGIESTINSVSKKNGASTDDLQAKIDALVKKTKNDKKDKADKAGKTPKKSGRKSGRKSPKIKKESKKDV